MSVRAVSFDLFNTLIHLEPDRDEIQLQAARQAGLAADLQALRRAILTMDSRNDPRRFGGRGAGSAAAAWAPYEQELLALAGHEVDLATAARIAEAALAVEQRYMLFDDALPVIDELRSRGLRVAILSNIPTALDEFVPHLELEAKVDVSIASGVVGFSKPDRRIFLAAAEALGLQPAEVLHVGDQLEGDVRGAAGAGMRGVLLDRHNLAPEWGDERVRSLSEVLGLV